MNFTTLPPHFIYYNNNRDELGAKPLQEKLKAGNIYPIRHVEKISIEPLLAFARDVTPAAVAAARLTHGTWVGSLPHDKTNQKELLDWIISQV